MLKVLMIGIALLTVACKDTSKSEMYFVNLDPNSPAYGQVRHGEVNFNYKTERREDVLSWTNSASVTTEPIENIKEQLVCEKTEYFFKTIKPEALKAHDSFWNEEENY